MQSIEQVIIVKTGHLGHIYSEGFYVSSKVLKYGKYTSSRRVCEEQARRSEPFHLIHNSCSSHPKGALSWYGKLTWESAHAWNLIILCLLIVWGMTFIFMVHLSFYAIPLLIYDVMYDITTIP